MERTPVSEVKEEITPAIVCKRKKTVIFVGRNDGWFYNISN